MLRHCIIQRYLVTRTRKISICPDMLQHFKPKSICPDLLLQHFKPNREIGWEAWEILLFWVRSMFFAPFNGSWSLSCIMIPFLQKESICRAICQHETYHFILECYPERYFFNFIQFIHGYGLGELCSMRQKLEPFQRCRSSLLSILHSNENDNIIHPHIFRSQFGGGVDPNFYTFVVIPPFSVNQHTPNALPSEVLLLCEIFKGQIKPALIQRLYSQFPFCFVRAKKMAKHKT